MKNCGCACIVVHRMFHCKRLGQFITGYALTVFNVIIIVESIEYLLLLFLLNLLLLFLLKWGMFLCVLSEICLFLLQLSMCLCVLSEMHRHPDREGISRAGRRAKGYLQLPGLNHLPSPPPSPLVPSQTPPTPTLSSSSPTPPLPPLQHHRLDCR